MEDSSYLSLLPNETLFSIFEELDASSQINAGLVCKHWKILLDGMEYVLWKNLCERTGRIRGELTLKILEEKANVVGWKRTYYWIKKSDLNTYESPSEIVDYLSESGEAENKLKKIFLISLGIENFPQSAILYGQYAESLIEFSEEKYWKMAEKAYVKSIELGELEEKNRSRSDENQSERPRPLLTLTYRYAHFLTLQPKNYDEADRVFKKLLRLIPGNSWVLERYAEFLTECKYRYNLAERIYRLILNSLPSSSTFFSYAMFLWQIRRNPTQAKESFRLGAELDKEKVYFLTNFMGRHYKEEQRAKELLESSSLYRSVHSPAETEGEQTHSNEQQVFALALAYHQIHCVDEAEVLYRKHIDILKTVNVYTVSNLAELLVHSRFNFDEAEELYRKGLEAHGGSHETIEIALAGLILARGNLQKGLPYLRSLLSAIHIRSVKTTLTEGSIILFIHSDDEKEQKIVLAAIKKKLLTENVRPKLILMFDANLRWAKEHRPHQYEWMLKLCQVYNCETDIEDLDEWDWWAEIEADLPPPDEEVDYDEVRRLFLDAHADDDVEPDEDEIEEEEEEEVEEEEEEDDVPSLGEEEEGHDMNQSENQEQGEEEEMDSSF